MTQILRVGALATVRANAKLIGTLIQRCGLHSLPGRSFINQRQVDGFRPKYRDRSHLPSKALMTASILLVEDNPITRKVARIALHSAEFHLTEAESGKAALAAVQQCRPDLVLQDLFLPDMDGYELFTRLRSVMSGRLPIVAFTGMSDERSILSLGFSDVLVKPVAPSELLRRIRAQLDRRLSEQRGDARRLLLLDDNEARHDALRSEFARRHFPLFSACGTLDTLINGELPDSILCNIDTPEGYKLVRQLRADERFAQVPLVLARSGEVTAADRRLAKRAAASAVVRYGPGAYQTVSAVALALEQDHSPRSASASALSSKLTSDSARRASESRREQAGRAISNMLSDLARHQRDSRPPRYVVESALASFLDAGGFTKGAGYAVDSDGKLRLTCSLGFPEIAAKGLDAFWGHMAVLHDSMSRPEPTELTLELGEHCSLLRAAALKSIIVIPVASGGAPLGILFAGSQNATLPAYSHEIAVRAGALLAQVFEINSTRRSLRP